MRAENRSKRQAWEVSWEEVAFGQDLKGLIEICQAGMGHAHSKQRKYCEQSTVHAEHQCGWAGEGDWGGWGGSERSCAGRTPSPSTAPPCWLPVAPLHQEPEGRESVEAVGGKQNEAAHLDRKNEEDGRQEY